MITSEFKSLMSETGHASDDCLIWSQQDMRNAIESRLQDSQKLKLTNDQCKQLLDEFFDANGDSIVSTIHDFMSDFIADRMQKENFGL